MPTGKYIRKTIQERLDRYVFAEPMSGCFLWAGSTTVDGYGIIGIDKRMVRVHRLAYETFVGPIPVGMHVLHKCDTPACCNPNHLFIGTDADNVTDCMKKGRRATPMSKKICKLTPAQVRAIREDTRTNAAIAKDYGICAMTVSNIHTRTTWKNLI